MEAQTSQSSGVIKFLAWFELNKKRVFICAGIAVLVGLAIFLVVNYQSQREDRASEALSDVKVPMNPMTPAPPGTADAYIKIARQYKGTQAGGRALIMAGTTLFAQGQFDEAQKYFEQFTREYPASPFVADAHFGVASCLDAKKKTAEATAKFEELRRRYGKSSVIEETKLALARLYEEQNRPAQALELYDDLMKANQFGGQFSGLGSEAGLRREDLLAAHPELRPTNAPPVLPTPPAINTNLIVRTMTNRAAASNVIQMMMTNRPAGTNVIRMTNLPQSLLTNKAALPTSSTSPLQINVTTNKF